MPAPPQRKGRSESLDIQRNEALIARFYYLGKFTDKRYTAVLKQVSHEHYISQRTVQNIIQDNHPILHRLRQQQPALAWFRKQWPHIVW